ncbi:MAG: Heat-inducible transcription repressor HrcA [Chlamydiia bacterium]|nr:Heat-inducible transcription repressor HrcA [Chlamydiia bacterium]
MKKKAITKKQRELDVLYGLIELFLRSGKAVGSNTLRENGFEYISSATIRNYFATLEAKGYLKQEHTSGGRAPSDLALRLYAEDFLENDKKPKLPQDDVEFLKSIIEKETKKLSFYLQEVTESISELTSLTTLITAPRFDQDFISKIILTKIDASLAVCIIVTDFGFIHTETLYLPTHMSTFSIKRIEEYFSYRLTSSNKPALSEDEEAFAKQAYNEVILRHFINYSNIDRPDIYKGGFSKLLRHTEFHDPETLSNTLSLFENNVALQNLLYQNEKLNIHIGDDLKKIIPPPYKSALIQIPYYVNNNIVGNIAILGPSRMNYKEIITLLETVSTLLSDNLTKNLYKYQLTYRTPKASEVTYTSSDLPVIGLTHKEKL